MAKIYQYLDSSSTSHAKQQIPAKRIWELLIKENKTVSYTSVRKVVSKYRAAHAIRTVSILQDPQKGIRAEFDWAMVILRIKGIEHRYSLAVIVLLCSRDLWFPPNSLEILFKQLRINGVYEYFRDCQPDIEELEMHMKLALQTELNKRRVNRQIKALRQARFPTKKLFEDLDPNLLPKEERYAISALKSLGFLKEQRNVILIGNSGTGKTHLAIATGMLACDNEYRVSSRTAAALINEIVNPRGQKRLSVYLRQFKKIDLLILDELGYVSFDRAGA